MLGSDSNKKLVSQLREEIYLQLLLLLLLLTHN